MHVRLDLAVLILGQGRHMDYATGLRICNLSLIVVEELDYVFLGLIYRGGSELGGVL